MTSTTSTPRRYVALYLGQAEEEALAHCPVGMQRGRWLNLLAGQIATWSTEQWEPFLANLAPRPNPRLGKLTVTVRPDIAGALDRQRRNVPMQDVLRTALLQAAGIAYQPIPTLTPVVRSVPALITTPQALNSPKPSEESSTPDSLVQPARNTASRALPFNPKSSPAKAFIVEQAPRSATQSWDFKKAASKSIRKLETDLSKGQPAPSICAADFTADVRSWLREWLRGAPHATVTRFWLGICHDPKGRAELPGLVDAKDTSESLQDACDRHDRCLRGKIVRYSLGGDAGGAVVLKVVLTTTSRAALNVEPEEADSPDPSAAVIAELEDELASAKRHNRALQDRFDEYVATAEAKYGALAKKHTALRRKYKKLDDDAEAVAKRYLALREKVGLD